MYICNVCRAVRDSTGAVSMYLQVNRPTKYWFINKLKLEVKHITTKNITSTEHDSLLSTVCIYIYVTRFVTQYKNNCHYCFVIHE